MTHYKFSYKCLLWPANSFRKPRALAHFSFISGEELKNNVSLNLPGAHFFQGVDVHVCGCDCTSVSTCVGVGVGMCVLEFVLMSVCVMRLQNQAPLLQGPTLL